MEDARVLVNFLSGPHCCGDKFFEVILCCPAHLTGLHRKMVVLVHSDAKLGGRKFNYQQNV